MDSPRGRGNAGTVVARLGGETYTDRLDIIRPAARVGLLDKLGKQWPALTTPDQRRHLKAELDRLAAEQAARSATEKEATAGAPPDPQELLEAMPESVRAQARAMLESPDLFKWMVNDIALLGVAGEKEIGATLYLVGVSRLLPHPLAVITQGPSSSGKSFVIVRVASLFPPESVLMATQLTPQSLFYMDPGSLVHRLVVVGERSRAEDDEAADATRALWEMISEGKLSNSCP